MGIRARYEALQKTHASLEEKIDSEMQRPRPDDAVLRRLKRRKLLIRDELEAIASLMAVVGDEATGEGTRRPSGRIVREHAMAGLPRGREAAVVTN